MNLENNKTINRTMKSLTAILKPVVLAEDAEKSCDDAFACLDEIITMCTNLQEGLQAVEGEMDESMMNCISSTREHIKSACECALEAYGFDACCDTCEEEEEEEDQQEEKDMGISKDDETKFHKKLDDLVHSTFGKRKDESVSEAASQKLDEAKKTDEPEEAGLKDYVMPKSVTKMLAKHQFNRVKAGTKLFDAVSKVDKKKDLLHLYTSKKHKNILVGMFMIGKNASYFIHDTEAKAQRLDNAGRYKDLKGFVAALTSKFEGSEKNESVKKPLTEILGEADAKQRTPRALAFVKLLEKHGFAAVPKEHPLYKKYNKSGKLLGLYAIPMRAGKYADIHIGVTNELVTDSYFITDGKNTKSFDNVADLTTYLKKLVAANSLNKLVEADINEKLKASDDVSVWIHDFVNSKNPKFAGKTKKERIDMALGAHYAAQGSKKK